MRMQTPRAKLCFKQTHIFPCAKICNSLLATLMRCAVLSISVLFTFPAEMGSKFRQEMNWTVPFYTPSATSSASTIITAVGGTDALLQRPKPTKTGILLRKEVGQYSFEDEDGEECTQLNAHDGSHANASVRNMRIRRQILKPSTPLKIEPSLLIERMSNKTDSIMDPDIDLHIDFLADFSASQGWTVAYIVFPPSEETRLCSHFFNRFSKSFKNLQTECGNPIEIFRKSEAYFNKKMRLRTAARPVFLFNFLLKSNDSIMTSMKSDVDILIKSYNRKVPIYLFGGIKRHSQPWLEKINAIQTNEPFKFTVVWTTDEEEGGFIVEDFYGFPQAVPIPQVIGNWNPALGLRISTLLMLGPANFQGRTLRITTVGVPPYVIVNKTESRVRCTGYLPDLVRLVGKQLNFTIVFMTPSDGAFGSPVDANGTWSGMVGNLIQKEAEIAMMSFSLTTARKGVMDFSPPVEFSSVRLLIRRDWENVEVNWSAFARPLAWDVWMAVPITLLLGVITLSTISFLRKKKVSPIKSSWLLSSCFIMQGQDEHNRDKSTPFRFVLGTFWVLAVILFASYTARLTSFLASSTDTMIINSLQQAVNAKSWKVGLVKGSAFIDRIKESQVDVLRSLYQKINEDPSALVGSFQEGMNKVYKERYVFFTSELTPTFLIKENCSYTWLPDKYYSGFGYMGYQKNLPFAPIISQRIAEVRQSGQLRRLFSKWWGKESLCAKSGKDSFVGMGLTETGAAFLIIFAGLATSATFLVTEWLWRKRRKMTTSHRSLLQSNTTLENNLVGSKSMPLFHPNYALHYFDHKNNFTF